MDFPVLHHEDANGIPTEIAADMIKSLAGALRQAAARRVLLIPPDITRSQSCAGWLTRLLFEYLSPAVHCNVLPALGSHRSMTREEQISFFGGGIPAEHFLHHDWRNGTVTLGEVPAETVADISGQKMREPIPVEISRTLMDGAYDAVISLGQVVPHEVAGMANYSKNLLVGCGGARMIDASHMLSVYAGTEQWIGRDYSPVRKLFDYAQKHFLDALPLIYLLTVTSPAQADDADTALNGLYIGGGRASFEKAVALSQRMNINPTGKPVQTCVVRLPAHEFRSAWLGNKAVYRTRNALADGAELIILAPGFECFGEDTENDRIIRQYGYCGRKRLLALLKTETLLQNHRSALAHLVQGSADERFTIRYCTPPHYADMIKAVGYAWGDIDEYAASYAHLHSGWNQMQDKDIYIIDNPALGLWEV